LFLKKQSEVKKEESKPVEIKKEEPKPVEIKKEEPKPVEIKKEEPKPVQVKKERIPELQTLLDMGFSDEEHLLEVLKTNNFNVAHAIQTLLS